MLPPVAWQRNWSGRRFWEALRRGLASQNQLVSQAEVAGRPGKKDNHGRSLPKGDAMTYQSGSAFRRALEQRLNARALATGLPLVRLRKIVAFDRFLARLVHSQPETWALKGGLALQLRLGGRSRTTKDIDLLSFAMADQVLALLREAAFLDLSDWFTFEVSEPTKVPHPDQAGVRYAVQTLLDGRTFEIFHVDVGIGDAVVEPLEYLTITDLLSFASLPPTLVPCYPITQQIAEKLHAYTKPRKSGKAPCQRPRRYLAIG